jgi:hypothetical protein
MRRLRALAVLCAAACGIAGCSDTPLAPGAREPRDKQEFVVAADRLCLDYNRGAAPLQEDLVELRRRAGASAPLRIYAATLARGRALARRLADGFADLPAPRADAPRVREIAALLAAQPALFAAMERRARADDRAGFARANAALVQNAERTRALMRAYGFTECGRRR